MKKLWILAFGMVLFGCGGNNQEIIEKKIENNTGVLNLLEIKEVEWSGLRFIRPYQRRQILGEEFNQQTNENCLWVFLGKDKVVESFEISREKADCIDLPDKVFTPEESIFLLRDGKLEERKRFKKSTSSEE